MQARRSRMLTPDIVPGRGIGQRESQETAASGFAHKECVYPVGRLLLASWKCDEGKNVESEAGLGTRFSPKSRYAGPFTGLPFSPSPKKNASPSFDWEEAGRRISSCSLFSTVVTRIFCQLPTEERPLRYDLPECRGLVTTVDTYIPVSSTRGTMAITPDIEAATALKTKGNKAFAQHDWPAAIDYYTQAIEKNDRDPSFYCNRAQVRQA